MKTTGRIYRWIIISILLQLTALLFVNIYLSKSNNIRAVGLDMDTRPKSNAAVKIPGNVSQVEVSYDGSYAGYIRNNKLIIVDVQKRKTVKTIDPGKYVLTNYRWLPDRYMVIYSTKSASNKTGRVQVSTYSVDTDIERSYPGITNLPAGSEIVDIELSPLTNIVYVKVKTDDSMVNVYRYNIMNNIKYIMSTGINTVFRETSYNDVLVYQTSKNKVYTRDGKTGSRHLLSFKEKAQLLGIDSEDKVYIGLLNSDGKVDKVAYAKLPEESGEKWAEIDLQEPVMPEDVYITSGGDIYTADRNDTDITNVTNSKHMKYSGKLQDIIDSYVVSMDGEKLRLTLIDGK